MESTTTPPSLGAAAALSFPCIEQPLRCVLSCHGRYLTSNRNNNGRVATSRNRSEKEHFLILPSNQKNIVTLQSFKFGGLLGTEKDEEEGTLRLKFQTPSDLAEDVSNSAGHEWTMSQAPNGGVFFQPILFKDKYLTCDDAGTVQLTNAEEFSSSSEMSQTWFIEYMTGELCFLSLPGVGNIEGRQVRCDLVGNLSLTPTCKGWEVWRFIEAGGGRVRISAWMHSHYYLVSNADGRVTTRRRPPPSTLEKNKEEEFDDTWLVEKAADGNGVVIRSALLGKRLYYNQQEELLCTSPQDVNDGEVPMPTVWHLSAAHSQTYCLYSKDRLKSLGPFPYVTTHVRQSDEWKIQAADPSQEGGSSGGLVVTLYCASKQQYLGCADQGQVEMVDEAGASELWYLSTNDGISYSLKSKEQNTYLSHVDNADQANGQLCLVAQDSPGEREQWCLDPCMPRAVSSKKIQTFAIGTSAAIATTVALPFALAGVVGLIGAEMGVLANIVTVGLTSAEAIASVGVVGATAALVFQESGDSISLHGEDVNEQSATKPYSKRPFCAWRSW